MAKELERAQRLLGKKKKTNAEIQEEKADAAHFEPALRRGETKHQITAWAPWKVSAATFSRPPPPPPEGTSAAPPSPGVIVCWKACDASARLAPLARGNASGERLCCWTGRRLRGATAVGPGVASVRVGSGVCADDGSFWPRQAEHPGNGERQRC